MTKKKMTTVTRVAADEVSAAEEDSEVTAAAIGEHF
jgi:hypothetical protein